MLHVRHFFQFEKQRNLLVARTESLHGTRPVDASVPAEQWKQVRVLFPIIVMNVRGADAALQQTMRSLDAFPHVGMAGVEADVQLEMRLLEEHQKTFRAGESVGSVFE